MSLLQDIQRHVGVSPDGVYGPDTEKAIARALGLHSATGERSISNDGLALIKQFEGLGLKAYKCPADVLTIGYGHTGADVKPGMVITEAQADALLRNDVSRFELAVRKLCPTTTQGQFDSLTSFTFNLGEKALEGSSLRKLHNAGQYADAAGEFAKWRFAGGKELAGLVKRRAAEAMLYRRQG